MLFAASAPRGAVASRFPPVRIAQLVKSPALLGMRAVTWNVRLPPADSVKSSPVLQLKGISAGCWVHGKGGEIDRMDIESMPERPSVSVTAPAWSFAPALESVRSNAHSTPGLQDAGPVFSILRLNGWSGGASCTLWQAGSEAPSDDWPSPTDAQFENDAAVASAGKRTIMTYLLCSPGVRFMCPVQVKGICVGAGVHGKGSAPACGVIETICAEDRPDSLSDTVTGSSWTICSSLKMSSSNLHSPPG